MKQYTKWLIAATVIACGLSASSIEAQTYDFSTGNIAYMGVAGGWNSSMYSITGSGLEVNDTTGTPGNTYGGEDYDLGAAIGSLHLHAADTQVTLSLTGTGPLCDYAREFSGVKLNVAA